MLQTVGLIQSHHIAITARGLAVSPLASIARAHVSQMIFKFRPYIEAKVPLHYRLRSWDSIILNIEQFQIVRLANFSAYVEYGRVLKAGVARYMRVST